MPAKNKVLCASFPIVKQHTPPDALHRRQHAEGSEQSFAKSTTLSYAVKEPWFRGVVNMVHNVHCTIMFSQPMAALPNRFLIPLQHCEHTVRGKGWGMSLSFVFYKSSRCTTQKFNVSYLPHL